MNLDDLAAELHQTAVEKGFWEPLSRMNDEDSFIFYAKQIAMIHSEATEVLEAIRKNKGEDQIVEELADIIIRTLDLYNGMHNQGDVVTSLHKTVKRKSKVNKDRPRLHGTLG
jgi:NTP pyrophosphatase (non-canonical NTP hydrolase)